jgi:hypothetical protein
LVRLSPRSGTRPGQNRIIKIGYARVSKKEQHFDLQGPDLFGVSPKTLRRARGAARLSEEGGSASFH